MSRPKNKSQSAMEYLMTYGWAILVILVVLGILYLLHVFSPGSLLGTSCTVNFKYLCQNPTLGTNGTISFVGGQNNDVNFYNAGFACTAAANSTTGGPYTSNGVSPWYYLNSTGSLIHYYNASSTYTLASSYKVNINSLPCYGTTGGLIAPSVYIPIGTSFSGILWVEYTDAAGQPGTMQNPWVISQMASITMQVTTHSLSTFGGTTSSTTTTPTTTTATGTTTASGTTTGSTIKSTTTAAVIVMTTTSGVLTIAGLPLTSPLLILIALVIIIVIVLVLYLRGRMAIRG